MVKGSRRAPLGQTMLVLTGRVSVAERVRFPDSITLTIDEALDIVTALEPAVEELVGLDLPHLAFALDNARVIVMDHLLGYEPGG